MSLEEVVLISAAFIYIYVTHKKYRKKRWWVRNYLKRRETSANLLSDLRISDGSFVNFTRMNIYDFKYLLNLIGPSITKNNTKFRNSVGAETRLAITLRFLSTGDSYTSLSYTFKVSKQLIAQIVPEVCKKLITALTNFIKIPLNAAEWKTIAEKFEIRWNFPHCIGCIDGKHIYIEAPINSGSEYYNYKNRFSIVLLAIVDADYNIIYANCGAKGKSSDSGVYESSPFYRAMKDNRLNLPEPEPLIEGESRFPFFLLGDKAFALSENMMKPYPGNYAAGDIKRIFNYRLCRCRRISENVFGLLCCVFRIFRNVIALKPENAENVTMTCLYLHNFLRRNARSRSLYSPPRTFDYEDADHNVVEGSWRREIGENINMVNLKATPRAAHRSALDIRDELAEYFITPQGAISWQLTHS